MRNCSIVSCCSIGSIVFLKVLICPELNLCEYINFDGQIPKDRDLGFGYKSGMKVRSRAFALSLALVLSTGGVCRADAGRDADQLRDQAYAKLEKKDYKGAIADCDRLIKLDADDSWAHTTKGNAYWYLDDMKSAAKEYEVSVKLDPSDASALENLAAAKEDLGDWKGALDDFIALSKLDEKTGYRRAATIMFDHDDPRASEFLRKAIALCPDDAGLKVTKARQYYDEEDYRRGLEEVDAAIKLDPQDAYGYLIRGYCYAALEEYSKAVKEFDRAIELNPTYADAFKQRAASKEKLDDKAGCILDYQKVMELEPGDEDNLATLTFTQIEMENFKDARKTIDRWFAEKPKPNILAYIARFSVRLEAQDYKGAWEDFVTCVMKFVHGDVT